jgi:hypothetical protein
MVELLGVRRQSDNSNSADMSEMYARPSTWDVSAYYFMPSFWIDDNLYVDEPLADMILKRANSQDGIQAKLAGQEIVPESSFLSTTISDRATDIHGLGEQND